MKNCIDCGVDCSDCYGCLDGREPYCIDCYIKNDERLLRLQKYKEKLLGGR